MGQRVIGKITRIAPDFEGLITKHTTFTPRHMDTMFGAPGGDYCHGGPGITFIPGYNAAQAVLTDR